MTTYGFRLSAVAATTIGVGLVAAPAACAGGIGVLGSPAFGNSCSMLDGLSQAAGGTAQGAGVSGNLAQLPLAGSAQSCGGADLPGVDDALKATQVAFGTDSLKDAITVEKNILPAAVDVANEAVSNMLLAGG
ncbi:hypothetical protein AB0O32_15680 [Streptomyces rubiginosohelvolus]|uniref:hypothetical protein n=1 Tax=Streptomyces rubiginosohelvolus TaxID=67362 RepID=UPI0034250211